jgi:hypothetical protein
LWSVLIFDLEFFVLWQVRIDQVKKKKKNDFRDLRRSILFFFVGLRKFCCTAEVACDVGLDSDPNLK